MAKTHGIKIAADPVVRSKFVLGTQQHISTPKKDQGSKNAHSSISGNYRGLSINNHFNKGNSRLISNASSGA